ncbi:hypothetical protein Rleg9DRAFT_0905 [Rhizobium leguminosarum bv. trifolii WSM597]|uniref:Uncharacterized protein n=1 Tax=Rhizobium leguminosarum bv. trifolii WSM597 TaxID=754764 RepID=I9X066_RHILT|nr:hypothetical protein Rleg9DRAFT_0905 [Rhizobium leguminosarum bv. trifolii WSM597]
MSLPLPCPPELSLPLEFPLPRRFHSYRYRYHSNCRFHSHQICRCRCFRSCRCCLNCCYPCYPRYCQRCLRWNCCLCPQPKTCSWRLMLLFRPRVSWYRALEPYPPNDVNLGSGSLVADRHTGLIVDGHALTRPDIRLLSSVEEVTWTKPRSTETDAFVLPTVTWKIVPFTTASR